MVGGVHVLDRSSACCVWWVEIGGDGDTLG